MAQPASVLRLQGGLGPLQDLPVQAVLTFRIVVQEARTALALTYRVGGTGLIHARRCGFARVQDLTASRRPGST